MTLKVLPDENAPEIVAQALVDIAEGFRKFETSRLGRRALVTLIHDHSSVSRRDIELVLNNLAQLDTIHLKPAKKTEAKK